jgi:hypothetical protein
MQIVLALRLFNKAAEVFLVWEDTVVLGIYASIYLDGLKKNLNEGNLALA